VCDTHARERLKSSHQIVTKTEAKRANPGNDIIAILQLRLQQDETPMLRMLLVRWVQVNANITMSLIEKIYCGFSLRILRE
jgi:hypothetical protein